MTTAFVKKCDFGKVDAQLFCHALSPTSTTDVQIHVSNDLQMYSIPGSFDRSRGTTEVDHYSWFCWIDAHSSTLFDRDLVLLPRNAARGEKRPPVRSISKLEVKDMMQWKIPSKAFRYARQAKSICRFFTFNRNGR